MNAMDFASLFEDRGTWKDWGSIEIDEVLKLVETEIETGGRVPLSKSSSVQSFRQGEPTLRLLIAIFSHACNYGIEYTELNAVIGRENTSNDVTLAACTIASTLLKRGIACKTIRLLQKMFLKNRSDTGLVDRKNGAALRVVRAVMLTEALLLMARSRYSNETKRSLPQFECNWLEFLQSLTELTCTDGVFFGLALPSEDLKWCALELNDASTAASLGKRFSSVFSLTFLQAMQLNLSAGKAACIGGLHLSLVVPRPSDLFERERAASYLASHPLLDPRKERDLLEISRKLTESNHSWKRREGDKGSVAQSPFDLIVFGMAVLLSLQQARFQAALSARAFCLDRQQGSIDDLEASVKIAADLAAVRYSQKQLHIIHIAPYHGYGDDLFVEAASATKYAQDDLESHAISLSNSSSSLLEMFETLETSSRIAADRAQGDGHPVILNDALRSIHEELSLTSDGPGFNDVVRDLCTEVTEQCNSLSQNGSASFIQFDSQGDAIAPMSGDIVMSAAYQARCHQVGVNVEGSQWLPVVPAKTDVAFPVRSYAMRSLTKHMQIVHEAIILAASDLSLGLIANTIAARTAFSLRPLESPLCLPANTERDEMNHDHILGTVSKEVDSVCRLASRALIYCPDVSSDSLVNNVDSDSNLAFGSIWVGPLRHVLRSASLTFPLRLSSFSALCESLCSLHSSASAIGRFIDSLSTIAISLKSQFLEGYLSESVHSSVSQTVTLEDERSVRKIFIDELRGTTVEEKLWTTSPEKAYGEDFAVNVDGYREDANERGRFLASRRLPLQSADIQRVLIDNFHFPPISLGKDGVLNSDNSLFERDVFSNGLMLRHGEPSIFFEIKQSMRQENAVYVIMTPDEGGRMKTFSGWALLVRRIVRAARSSVSESSLFMKAFSDAAGVDLNSSIYLLDKNRTIRSRELWNKGLGNDLDELSAAARLLSAGLSHCVNLPGLIAVGLLRDGGSPSISISNILDQLALSCLELLNNVLFPLASLAQEQIATDKSGRLSYELCNSVQRHAQSFMSLLATLSSAYPSAVYRPLVVIPSETIMDFDTGMNNDFPLLLPISIVANTASRSGDKFYLPMMRVFQSVLHTAQRHDNARLLATLINQGKEIAHKALADGLGYETNTASQSSCLGACLMLQSRGLRLISALLSCGATAAAAATTETNSQPQKRLSQLLLLQENPSDARLLYYVVRAALQIPLAAASQKALQSFKDADITRLEERKAAAVSHETWDEKRRIAEEAEEACVQVRLPLDLSSHVLGEHEGDTCYLSDADLALAEQVTLSALLILQSLFLTTSEQVHFPASSDPISFLSAQKTNMLLSFSLPEGADKLCLGHRSRVTVGTHLSTHSDAFSRRSTAREPAAYLPPMLLNPVLALLSLVGYDSALVYPLKEHRVPEGLRYVAAVHSPLSSDQCIHIAPASIDTTALSVFTLFTRCMTAKQRSPTSSESSSNSQDIGDVIFSDLRTLNFSRTSNKLQLCNRKGMRELLLGNALIKGATRKATRVHDAVLLGSLRLARVLFEHEKVLHALLNRDDLLEEASSSQVDSVDADSHHPSILDAALEVLLLKQDMNLALGPKLLCESLSFLLQLWQRAASGSASAVILRETQRVRKMDHVWQRIADLALQSSLHQVESSGERLTFDEKDLVSLSRSVFEEEPHAIAKSIVTATRASYAIRSAGLALQLLTFELSWSQSRGLSGAAKGMVESKINSKIFNDLFERFFDHSAASIDPALNQLSIIGASASTSAAGDTLLRFVLDSCTRLNFAPVSSLHCSMRGLAHSVGISPEKYRTPSLDAMPPVESRPLRTRTSEYDNNNNQMSGDVDVSDMNDGSIPQGSAPIVFLNSVLLNDAAAQPLFGRNYSFSVDHLASDLNLSSAWLRMQSPFVTQLVSGEKRGLFDDIKNRLKRNDSDKVVDAFFSDQSQTNELYRKGACLWAMTLHNTYASVAAAQLTRLRGAMALFVTVILGPLFEKQRVTASTAPIETRVALINCATIAWSRLARGLASAFSRFGFGDDTSADAATIAACFTLAQVASVFLNGAISLGSHENIAKYSLGINNSGATRSAEAMIEKAKLACLEVVIEGLQRSPIRAGAFHSGTSSSRYLSQQAMRLTALQVTAATSLCPRTPMEPYLPLEQGISLPLTLSKGKLDLLAKIAVEAMKDALEGIKNNLNTPTTSTVWSSSEAGTLESASLHFTAGVDLLSSMWKLHASAFAPSVDRSFAKAMSTPMRKSRLTSPFSHLMAAEELASSNTGFGDIDNAPSNPSQSPVIEALLLARATFDSATKTIAALLSQHHQNWLRFLVSHADAVERVSRSTHDQREHFFAGIGLGNPNSYNMGIGGSSDSLSTFSLAASQRASLSPSETSTLRGLSRLIRSSLVLAHDVASGGGIEQKGAMSVAQLGFAESVAGNALFVHMNSVLNERIQSGADVWGGTNSNGGKKSSSKNALPSPFVRLIDNPERISASSVAEYLVSRGLIASRQAALLLTFAACGHGLSPCAPIRGYGQSGLQRCELHLAWCDAISLCTVLVKVASSHSMYSSLDAVITLGGVKDVCAKFAEGDAGRIALYTALGGSSSFPAFSIAAAHEASCAALFLAALSDSSVVKTHLAASSVRGRLDEENTVLLEGTLSRLRESPYSHWKREVSHENQSLCEAAPLLSAFSLRDACAAYKTLAELPSALGDDYFARVGRSFSMHVTEATPSLSLSGVSREDIIGQFVPSSAGIHRLRFAPVSESEASAAALHRKSPRASPSGSMWRCAAISSLRHLLASTAALSAASQRLAPNVGLKSSSRFIPDSIDFHGASVVRAWMLQKLLQADVLSSQDQHQIDLALESDKASPFARSDALYRPRMTGDTSDMADEDDSHAANLPLPGPEDLCLAIHAAVKSPFCTSSRSNSDDDFNHSSGVLPTYPSPPTYFVESIDDEDGQLSDEGNARLTFAVLGVPHEVGSEMKTLIRNGLFLLSVSVDRNFQACAFMSRNERDVINVPAIRSLFTSAIAAFGDAGLLKTTLKKLLEVELDYKQTDESEKSNNFDRFGTMRSPTNMSTTSRGVSAGGGGDVPTNNQRSSVYAVFRDSRSTLDDVLKMYEAQYVHSVSVGRMETMSNALTQTIAKILGDSESSSSDPLRLEVVVSHLLSKILFIYFMHERQAISGGRYQDDESNVGLNLLELAFGEDINDLVTGEDEPVGSFTRRIERAKLEDKNSGLDPITYSLGLELSNASEAFQVRIVGNKTGMGVGLGGTMESLD